MGACLSCPGQQPCPAADVGALQPLTRGVTRAAPGEPLSTGAPLTGSSAKCSLHVINEARRQGELTVLDQAALVRDLYDSPHPIAVLYVISEEPAAATEAEPIPHEAQAPHASGGCQPTIATAAASRGQSCPSHLPYASTAASASRGTAPPGVHTNPVYGTTGRRSVNDAGGAGAQAGYSADSTCLPPHDASQASGPHSSYKRAGPQDQAHGQGHGHGALTGPDHADALYASVAVHRSGPDGPVTLVFSTESGRTRVGCVLTNPAAMRAMQLQDEQEVLDFLARKAFTRDAALKYLFNDVLRRLMQGQLTTVSHFVPGDFGHERYFLSLRISPFAYQATGEQSLGCKGPTESPSPPGTCVPPTHGTLLPAMVLELDVPYEGKELAARLHRDYMILSSIPSIVTIFTMDGHVLHQNRSSIAYMGYLVELAGSPGAQSAAAATERGGSSSSSTRPGTAAWVERRPVPDRDGRRDPAGGVGSGAVPPSPRGGTNWLQQLFALEPHKLDAMMRDVAEGREWRGLVRVPEKLHPPWEGAGPNSPAGTVRHPLRPGVPSQSHPGTSSLGFTGHTLAKALGSVSTPVVDLPGTQVRMGWLRPDALRPGSGTAGSTPCHSPLDGSSPMASQAAHGSSGATAEPRPSAPDRDASPQRESSSAAVGDQEGSRGAARGRVPARRLPSWPTALPSVGPGKVEAGAAATPALVEPASGAHSASMPGQRPAVVPPVRTTSSPAFVPPRLPLGHTPAQASQHLLSGALQSQSSLAVGSATGNADASVSSPALRAAFHSTTSQTTDWTDHAPGLSSSSYAFATTSVMASAANNAMTSSHLPSSGNASFTQLPGSSFPGSTEGWAASRSRVSLQLHRDNPAMPTAAGAHARELPSDHDPDAGLDVDSPQFFGNSGRAAASRVSPRACVAGSGTLFGLGGKGRAGSLSARGKSGVLHLAPIAASDSSASASASSTRDGEDRSSTCSGGAMACDRTILPPAFVSSLKANTTSGEAAAMAAAAGAFNVIAATSDALASSPAVQSSEASGAHSSAAPSLQHLLYPAARRVAGGNANGGSHYSSSAHVQHSGLNVAALHSQSALLCTSDTSQPSTPRTPRTASSTGLVHYAQPLHPLHLQQQQQQRLLPRGSLVRLASSQGGSLSPPGMPLDPDLAGPFGHGQPPTASEFGMRSRSGSFQHVTGVDTFDTHEQAHEQRQQQVCHGGGPAMDMLDTVETACTATGTATATSGNMFSIEYAAMRHTLLMLSEAGGSSRPSGSLQGPLLHQHGQQQQQQESQQRQEGLSHIEEEHSRSGNEETRDKDSEELSFLLLRLAQVADPRPSSIDHDTPPRAALETGSSRSAFKQLHRMLSQPQPSSPPGQEPETVVRDLSAQPLLHHQPKAPSVNSHCSADQGTCPGAPVAFIKSTSMSTQTSLFIATGAPCPNSPFSTPPHAVQGTPAPTTSGTSMPQGTSSHAAPLLPSTTGTTLTTVAPSQASSAWRAGPNQASDLGSSQPVPVGIAGVTDLATASLPESPSAPLLSPRHLHVGAGREANADEGAGFTGLPGVLAVAHVPREGAAWTHSTAQHTDTTSRHLQGQSSPALAVPRQSSISPPSPRDDPASARTSCGRSSNAAASIAAIMQHATCEEQRRLRAVLRALASTADNPTAPAVEPRAASAARSAAAGPFSQRSMPDADRPVSAMSTGTVSTPPAQLASAQPAAVCLSRQSRQHHHGQQEEQQQAGKSSPKLPHAQAEGLDDPSRSSLGVQLTANMTIAPSASRLQLQRQQKLAAVSLLGARSAALDIACCWHEVHVRPVSDPMGSGPVLMVIQTDCTSKVRAEELLTRALEAEHRLLADIFPRHVVRYMTQRRKAMAEHERNGLLLLRHLQDPTAVATLHSCVTVLFADIKGFTAMCKEVPPAVVMTFLNDLYTRFDSLTDVYGVYKVETIGDCYMVAGGLMSRDEDGLGRMVLGEGEVDPLHAMRVVAFARAMLEEALKVALPNTGERVQVRVGMHSGPVVSGVVGQKMPRFCLFGDTINTASRMESTGSPGAIHISAATRALLPSEEDNEGWEPTGGVEVKGKGVMDTYLWTAHSEVAGRQIRGKRQRAMLLGTLSSLPEPVAHVHGHVPLRSQDDPAMFGSPRASPVYRLGTGRLSTGSGALARQLSAGVPGAGA